MIQYEMKNFEEMKDIYLRKVGKIQLDGDYIECNEHGFITFSFLGEVMVLPDLYGDGKYWLNRALEIGKENNCKKLRGGTTRNIKAYCKMFGLEVIGYIVEREI
jgi:hypothetical protein